MKQNIPIFGSKWMMLTLQGSMETNFLVLIWFRFVKFLLNPNWKHLQFVKQFSPTFSMDQAESETAVLLICNTGFGARLRQVLEVADTGFGNLGILNLFRFQNYQEVHLCLAGVNIQKNCSVKDNGSKLFLESIRPFWMLILICFSRKRISHCQPYSFLTKLPLRSLSWNMRQVTSCLWDVRLRGALWENHMFSKNLTYWRFHAVHSVHQNKPPSLWTTQFTCFMKIQPGLDNHRNLVNLLLWNFHSKPSEKHQTTGVIKNPNLNNASKWVSFNDPWTTRGPKRHRLAQPKQLIHEQPAENCVFLEVKPFGSVPLPLMWSYFLRIRAEQAGFRETYTSRTRKSWGQRKTRQLLGGSSH